MPSPSDDYRAVAERLGERIAVLAPELLPNGEPQGRRWWRCGSVAGEPGQSLAIELTGRKQGRWFDYAAGEGGDALDLIAAVRCHGDKREAFAWARHWLRLPEREPDPGIADGPRSRRRAEASNGDYVAWVRRIWLDARPLERGDPVDRYLEGRGIALAELGRAPRALRYHPALWNGQTRRAWPAMVAAINSLAGGFAGVHCTWLEADPFGVTKAPIADRHGGAKRTFGSYAGGAIRLWRGASGKPWRDMPAGEVVIIGEGIEDTLSAVVNRPAWRAVCAVSLSSMLVLDLPPQAGTVVILGQNDPPDSRADKLLRRVVVRFVEDGRAAGRRVRLAKPPAFLGDWNDLAMWCRKTGTDITWADWGEN